MAVLVFVLLCIAAVFVLAMRRAPIWAGPLPRPPRCWPGAPGWSMATGTSPPFNLLGILAWVPVVILAGLAIAPIRRAALITPAFHKIKGILPKVSATEQEGAERRHIGFDAELFSGQPDWTSCARCRPSR